MNFKQQNKFNWGFVPTSIWRFADDVLCSLKPTLALPSPVILGPESIPATLALEWASSATVWGVILAGQRLGYPQLWLRVSFHVIALTHVRSFVGAKLSHRVGHIVEGCEQSALLWAPAVATNEELFHDLFRHSCN